MSPDALKRARERFARQFRKDFVARIEREREAQISRPASVLNAERDAQVIAMGADHTVGEIATVLEIKGQRVRSLLGMPPAPPQPPRRRVRATQPAL